MAPVDWSRCFICKKKTHKKSKDLINLCTFEACESIRIAAERKGDSSMLHILNGLVVSDNRARPSNALNQSTAIEDERQILSIAQDIIHCNSKGRVKLPKHTSLAICVHHLTTSKRLIELLNRMGHCVSYDEMRAVNTSIAEDVLAKAEEFGTVIPTVIKAGSFVQIAADNNDLNEETIDGKNTTHATTMVIYQNRTFGPDPPPNPVEQRPKRRSLQATGTVYDIEQCSVRGRRPAVTDHVGSVDMKWYDDLNNETGTARKADFIWTLLRLCPKKFGEAVVADVFEKQSIPSWAGFNAILYPEMPVVSNIGYCPMIDGSSNDFSTIYTVLKHAQKISAAMGQADAVVTFDLAIYSKAKEIQWRFPNEFSNVVVRMGGFHVVLNFLSLLGKKFADSGLDDLLIESGVYAAGSTSALMKGKSYNRGIRAHKLCLEVFFRLMWDAFILWYESRDEKIPEEPVLHKIVDCVRAVESDKESARESVRKITTDLTEITDLFAIFKSENQERSNLFAFWDEYCSMVTTLLQFLKAERTGNWKLHLSSTAAMLPQFFAMDRQNYARYLPVYLADMQKLELTHPEVYKEFAEGNHSISRSGQPFSQVSTDMALEQSINADSKSSGGVIGISQSPSALERWFLTIHERASITSALKAMFGLQDGEQASHKEAAPRRVRRDEEDVKKMISCFSSGLMTNPFNLDSDALLNIATGVVLPEDVAQTLVHSTEKGRQQMKAFVEQRINSNAVGFWEPIPNMKIKTFSSANKKIHISLKDVLSFELSPVPYSLANADGSLRKGTKSVLCSLLEKDVNVVQQLTALPNPTVVIIDGMAIIQMSKSAGTSTFGDLSEKYYNIFTAPLFSNNCVQVHVVFDQYWENSIKEGERERRGASVGLEVRIGGPTTPVPRQWGKYISNPKNKVNLCDFLSAALCRLGENQLPPQKELVIGGGFRDGEKAVTVTRGQCREVQALRSNHEEADTRMILHAKYAARTDRRLVIQSPDTDVLILSVSHFRSLGCPELWFRTGLKDRQRMIPVHDIAHALGEKLCRSLPGFHAITGCDSTSVLAGIGKKKAWDSFCRGTDHQDSVSHLGEEQELNVTTAGKCEAFVCSLYTTSKKASTVDELRYFMFCQKSRKTKCFHQSLIVYFNI
ncbi:unnamed protein product [Porites evermanni]|uniref:Uncharacterized protein n=1 Tax=Porites evermanni TaxID=104178 RepID=A0ABN8R8G5_9CNID|nr:unnamed protein product [Porites evermanni]